MDPINNIASKFINESPVDTLYRLTSSYAFALCLAGEPDSILPGAPLDALGRYAGDVGIGTIPYAADVAAWLGQHSDLTTAAASLTAILSVMAMPHGSMYRSRSFATYLLSLAMLFQVGASGTAYGLAALTAVVAVVAGLRGRDFEVEKSAWGLFSAGLYGVAPVAWMLADRPAKTPDVSNPPLPTGAMDR